MFEIPINIESKKSAVCETPAFCCMDEGYDFVYHINGIKRYLTFFLYSRYPFNSFSSNASSFLIRLAMMNGYARKMINE